MLFKFNGFWFGLLICFYGVVNAQFERIIEQPENPRFFHSYNVQGSVFVHFQHDVGNGNYESFIVKGNLDMNFRDTLKFSQINPNKLLVFLGQPIGDSIFPVVFSELIGSEDYENELLFVDTALNVRSSKVLSVTKALPHKSILVNDSILYLIGNDVLGDYDLYVGAYEVNGDLVRDSLYDIGLDVTNILSEANGDLLLSTNQPNYNFDHKTFAIDSVSNRDFYRGDYKFQMLSHPNGYVYMTGWISPYGNVSSPTIGLYVKKFDSSGMIVDSTGIEFSRGQDVYSYNRESCVLKTGDLLLPYRWDSVHYESVYLRLMIVDENLNVKRTIKRFFDRDFWISSSAALSDGGAVVFGRIQDTVDFGYDTYFLRLDSLGNFSPLTIIDDVAPKVTSLSLYPNPADDHIFIKGIDDQALIDVLVMNEAGGLEQKTQLSYPFKLETSDLPSGVYTLLLLGAEGNNTSLKMVKN